MSKLAGLGQVKYADPMGDSPSQITMLSLSRHMMLRYARRGSLFRLPSLPNLPRDQLASVRSSAQKRQRSQVRCPVAGRTARPSLSLDGINLPARHHYKERDTHLRERLR